MCVFYNLTMMIIIFKIAYLHKNKRKNLKNTQPLSGRKQLMFMIKNLASKVVALCFAKMTIERGQRVEWMTLA